MAPQGVYHEGELSVQALTGERELAERHGRGILPSIMPGAWAFLARQQLVALATGTAGGEVWASAWFGEAGFVESQAEGLSLRLDRRKLASLEVDPVLERLRPGSPLGLLAIEPFTRKRLRVNGTVQALDEDALVLDVREAFANCPKYIAQRELVVGPASGASRASGASAQEGETLDAARRATLRRTDTLFVGSLHPERGADASHRGGSPGFVNVVDGRTLRIPDYAGNGMYQTLGNLQATGRAGLVCLDFEGGRLLHLTGKTQLCFEESRHETGGTGRSWELSVERWVEGALPGGVTARLLKRSPFNPKG